MKSATQLRDELADIFDNLKAGALQPKEAAELANVAGKMINSAKVQLEYYALKKETPSIPFLDQGFPWRMDMTDELPIEKLTRVYIKMRDKKDELSRELEEKIGELEADMKRVKLAILDHMKELNAESLRTNSGTVFRTVRTTYSTNDWDSMNKFILEHGLPDLLEKRIHQTNMKAFLEENPDELPPGLNANMEYSVTIRRSKNAG